MNCESDGYWERIANSLIRVQFPHNSFEENKKKLRITLE